MTNHARRVAIAMACTAGLTSGAFSQPAGQTTLVGCLYRESDIPVLVMSQPGSLLDDYILADATVAGAPATGAVGTSGSIPPAGRLYELERISEGRLNPLVGKRVQVTGRIDADPEHLSGVALDMEDLPEFETTFIREVAGTCPLAPSF